MQYLFIFILNRDVGGHKGGDCIDWLNDKMHMSKQQACEAICGTEYPGLCEENNP